MGCNQSKSDDINNAPDRAREPKLPKSPGPRAVPTGKRPVEEGGAKSYSQQREEDIERHEQLLKRIVDQTAQNLIDVAHITGPLESKEASNRAKDFEAAVHSVSLARHNNLALPQPSKSNLDVMGLLQANVISSSDIRQLTADAEKFSTAYTTSVKLVDKGELIVAFPVIEEL